MMLFITGASIVVYFLICAINGRLNLKSAFGIKNGSHSFAVLERDSKTIALRSDRPFRSIAGLIYTAGYFLAFPILLWRYGVWRTAILLASPFAASFALAAAATPFIGISPDNSFAMKVMLAPVFRGAIGYMLGSHDAAIVLARQTQAGWCEIDNVKARNSREAVLAVRPQSPSTFRVCRNWLATHLRLRRET